MKKKLLTLLFVVCLLGFGYAQTAELDQSFGEKGIVRTDMGSPINFSYGRQQVLYQTDGSFYFILETAGQVVINKRHADGSVDISYGRNGVSVSLVMTGPHAILQPDGRIVVAGSTININSGYIAIIGPETYEIARFNTDGSLDNSFNESGIILSAFSFANFATGVALQTDGKIVVTGNGLVSNASNQVIQLARYNSDGNLDSSFGNGGSVQFGFRVNSNCVTIQNNGQILVGGSVLLRYNTDGTLDNLFNGNGKEDIGGINEIAVQADGKIVLRLNGGFSLARINAKGGLDSTFNSNGNVTIDFGGTNDQANSLAIQTDGKIILAGKTSTSATSSFAIARYHPNGSLDNSFSSDGKQVVAVGSYSYVNSLIIQADGKLFALGINTEGSKISIATARFNAADGSLDPNYNATGLLIDHLSQGYTFYTSAAVQPDGKILAAGYSWNGLNVDFALTRYNINGSFDNSFSGGGKLMTDFGGADDRAKDIAIQTDGKIILAGVSGGKFAIARYNTNGSMDITFNGNGLQTTAFSNADTVTAVAIQKDGKIIVAGTGIARYNTNGALDMSFGTGGRLNTTFFCDDFKIQADGKILALGKNTFSSVARYNTDGSPDISFASTGIRVLQYYGVNPVLNFRSLVLQNNGKIIVGGYYEFVQKQGTDSRFAVTRINADGTDDNTFNGGQPVVSNLNGEYETSAAIQNDGKIVLGGYYQNGNNEDFTITRYNTDGSLDNTFGGGSVVTAASRANDRIAKLLISGNSLYAAGFGQFPGNFGVVARYLLGPTGGPLPLVLTDFTASLQNNNNALLQWQTASEQNLSGFIIERSTATNDFTAIGYVAAKGNTNSKTNYIAIDKQPLHGVNFYRLKMTDNSGKFVYSKIVSVDVKNELFSINLSPNPATNILNIKLNGLNENATVQIIDANGIKLKETLFAPGNGASAAVDINNLSPGIYNVRLQTISRVVVLKFIKE
ncbi:T9SS type A sorting domain-containing protein [Ferruginibacter sp.]|uniref:T9SS type A sorting domain-containing protein n=1 Tax=Ferruginibacter sp. TaxID=1940288 RepID=UPI0019BE3423|nr:T9SS type A sorting domain-containing protein [Ferruginibacter sp.]MBC7626960.1 T9SS type A sorting domain-containing protein [Ferruginibacter sp.]